MAQLLVRFLRGERLPVQIHDVWMPKPNTDFPLDELVVMRTHYQDQIQESEQELENLERSLRGQALCDRVKMLRLLKSGAYDSRRTLASTLGYSERQLQRWWKLYKKAGIDGLLEEKAVGGSTERVTDVAWQALKRAMRNGQIKQLKEAQAYLKDLFGIEYNSLQGLSDMIRRRSIADMMAERMQGKKTPLTHPPASKAAPSDTFVDEAKALLLDQSSKPLPLSMWGDV